MMNPTKALLHEVKERIAVRLGTKVEIHESLTLGGGSINDSYRIDTTAGTFFLKVNRADRFPSMFEAEKDSLQRLRKSRTFRIPEVFAHGEVGDDTYLLLEYIEQGLRTEAFWIGFGRSLAALHRTTADHFGLDRDNYIGSLEQVNSPHARWSEFFIHCRLEPQLKLARDAKRVEAGMAFRFERLFAKLDRSFPMEPPALLHGDLWSGNFLAGPNGEAVLFDPAVYHGHREMDIAMTRLFGGSETPFLNAYQDEWPLEPGWEDRSELCNLYPLLVHVNLFGEPYLSQVRAILGRFA